MNVLRRKKRAVLPPAPSAASFTPPARKLLVDMTLQEKADWAQARHDGLAAFVVEATRYRSRRNWPGSENNPTNQIYDRFLPEAADLLQALEEMTAAAQTAQEGNKNP